MSRPPYQECLLIHGGYIAQGGVALFLFSMIPATFSKLKGALFFVFLATSPINEAIAQYRHAVGVWGGSDFAYNRHIKLIPREMVQTQWTPAPSMTAYYEYGPRDSVSGVGGRLYVGQQPLVLKMAREDGSLRTRTFYLTTVLVGVHYQKALTPCLSLRALAAVGASNVGSYNRDAEYRVAGDSPDHGTSLRMRDPLVRPYYRAGLEVVYGLSRRIELGIGGHFSGNVSSVDNPMLTTRYSFGQNPVLLQSSSQFQAFSVGGQLAYRFGFRR